MAINPNVFIHNDDRAALEALKAIPGFSSLTKSFMRSWNEKLMYINNMSTYVRLSEKQLPRYYAMLPPICEKLGIEVPDLFLKLDVVPNAYTYGEEKPFIVLTSGLLETIPEELLPTVLAHECGHIACHHVLYRTMGTMLINGMLGMIPLANVAILPLKAAFAYWMRCSEFSADRAAIVCDGTAEKVTEMCMRFAGLTKAVSDEMNLEEFMNQAKEYRELIDDSKLNKMMEQMLFTFNDHPINAVRASEAKKWADSEDFRKTMSYLEAHQKNEQPQEQPFPFNRQDLLGKKPEELKEELLKAGYANIDFVRTTDSSFFSRAGTVTDVLVNGEKEFREGDWMAQDAKIELHYYQPLSNEEIKRMHPGEIMMPASSKSYIGRPCKDVFYELRDAGFTNIRIDKAGDITKENDRDLGRIISVSVNGNVIFARGAWTPKDAEIILRFHTFAN